MTVILCLILLFFSSASAKLTNESVATPSQSCQANITCPAIVAPLCARVLKKNQTEEVKKSIFIVVVNKCEMQYMKCHQGVEAAIVPMKNCEAGHGKPISKPIGLLKKRVKRQADIQPRTDFLERLKKRKPTRARKPKPGTTKTTKPTKTTKSKDDSWALPSIELPFRSSGETEERDSFLKRKPATKPRPKLTKPRRRRTRRTRTTRGWSVDVSVEVDIEHDNVLKRKPPRPTRPTRPTRPPTTTKPTRKTRPKQDWSADVSFKVDITDHYPEDTIEPDYFLKRRPTRPSRPRPTKPKPSTSKTKKRDHVSVDVSVNTNIEHNHKERSAETDPEFEELKSDELNIYREHEGDFKESHFSNENPRSSTKKGDAQYQKHAVPGYEDITFPPTDEYSVESDHITYIIDMKATGKDAEEYDEEIEQSPEDPDLVMPPSGGGPKELAGEDDNLDVNDEIVENNDEDAVPDENNGEDALPAENGKDYVNPAVIAKKDGIDKEDKIPPLQHGDWQDYTNECPKSCPSRDVMVCARCTHDVYRTFLSTCHLRMFACEQPDEKLQLVSRTACAASAPFLADLSDSVKRVTEAGDDDAVLRFVYCRMKGLDGGRSHVAFEGTNAKCEVAAPA